MYFKICSLDIVTNSKTTKVNNSFLSYLIFVNNILRYNSFFNYYFNYIIYVKFSLSIWFLF